MIRLSGVRRVFGIVLRDHHRTEIAMGSDSPADGRSGADFNVELQVFWEVPEAYVNLNSDGVYKLKTVPVVLKVLLGRDPGSESALVPDARVLDRGDTAGPDVSMADLGKWFPPSIRRGATH